MPVEKMLYLKQKMLKWQHCLQSFNSDHDQQLDQGSQTRGPREHFVWPATNFWVLI